MYGVFPFAPATSGLPWTILRPGFFAQNLGDTYRADIRGHDRAALLTEALGRPATYVHDHAHLWRSPS